MIPHFPRKHFQNPFPVPSPCGINFNICIGGGSSISRVGTFSTNVYYCGKVYRWILITKLCWKLPKNGIHHFTHTHILLAHARTGTHTYPEDSRTTTYSHPYTRLAVQYTVRYPPRMFRAVPQASLCGRAVKIFFVRLAIRNYICFYTYSIELERLIGQSQLDNVHKVMVYW